jgi:plasmid stabilization system protein ParE
MRAKFHVETVAEAESDLRAIHEFIARDKPKEAAQWLHGATKAIRSLRFLPFLHEVVPETEELGLERRHLIYGNYQILFRVEENPVRVLRVIHAARRLTREMLEDAPD